MGDQFADKWVFVTGATGFLGKVFVEKLLRCSPTVDQIVLLIRSRKSVKPEGRLRIEIIGSSIFDRLRSEIGAEAFSALVASKLVVVAGDITFPSLGLQKQDAQMVRERAQIVVHSAATVQFNEVLDTAIKMNCMGALNAIRFARSLRRLECYVHVSTAYVNCNLRKLHIHEQLYPLDFDPHDALRRVMRATPTELEQLSTQLMGAYPNTYTLTKSMAEHLITREVSVCTSSGTSRTDFPLVIYRPTTIGAAWKEPVPGWIDQLDGPGTVIAAVGMGVLTMLPGDPDHVADIVPVDLAVNTIILAASARMDWDRRALRGSCAVSAPFKPLIVHSGTSDPRQKPLRMGILFSSVADYFHDSPPRAAIFEPKFRLIKDPEEFQMQWSQSYTQPTAAYAEMAKKSGNWSIIKQASHLSQRMRRARKLLETYQHFAESQWVFRADATFDILREFANPTLWVDAHDLDWKRYLVNFCIGLKKYALQEPEGITVDIERVHQTWLEASRPGVLRQEIQPVEHQLAVSKL